MSPRYEPARIAAEPPDVWTVSDLGQTGMWGVKFRETCDHEAIHAAAAVALGWTVTRVAVVGRDRGVTEFEAPATGNRDRHRRERLAITFAPNRVAGATQSTDDAHDCYRLTREIAGEGVAAHATDKAVGRVYEQAAYDVANLAETRVFKFVRLVVREALADGFALDRDDMAQIVAQATGQSTAPVSQKPAAAAARKASAPVPKRDADKVLSSSRGDIRSDYRTLRASGFSADKAIRTLAARYSVSQVKVARAVNRKDEPRKAA